MLEVLEYNDLLLFKIDVIPFLQQNETENNLSLGILNSLEDGGEKPLLMAAVLKNDKLSMVLLQTIPVQVIFSKPAGLTTQDYKILGSLLVKLNIPGIVGEKECGLAVMDAMSDHLQKKYAIGMNQRIYKLDHVTKAAAPDGKLRILRHEDLSVVKEWVYLFHEEIDQPIDREEAGKIAAAVIKKGCLHGWESKAKLVSMANISRPTKTNCTVTLVFTPKEERGFGFASSCVSALSQKMLNQGFRSTSLYTDLDNPTSNKIYIEIGYKPIMDSVAVHFTE
ncbi:GNAT family acetyltransferase [Jeotgalibacillus sp. S-D1]|uniref:GNAT family N-acetyltransferase n=1 Tax=Jeotgalibacillus sp. S-D1 TaxID=2552189 RepID=UPI00105A14CA|nr:GNAT family N-acetyltransferase [Jeotgalibacillus sp. S-D1]TDL30925.1 GNAT family acetyltransferase [Jeotgalibacillus sp. S-D1]